MASTRLCATTATPCSPGLTVWRLAVKTDGTVEAALWREAIRVWAEHHPQAGVTWAEAVEEGWPEYLVADKYHLFVHRKEDYNKSARTAVLDYQGPDTYMYFQPPITGIDRLMPRPPARRRRSEPRCAWSLFMTRPAHDHGLGVRPAGEGVGAVPVQGRPPSRHDPDRRVAHAGSPPVAGPDP